MVPVVHSRRPLWDTKYPDLEMAHAPGTVGVKRSDAAQRDTMTARRQPSETIHLPSPTYYPLILAVGLTVASFGVLYAASSGGLTAILIVAGLLIMGFAIAGWIRAAHADAPH